MLENWFEFRSLKDVKEHQAKIVETSKSNCTNSRRKAKELEDVKNEYSKKKNLG